MNKYAFKVYAHANKRIQKRIDKLEEMADDLHAKLLEKYPYDLYGMKADILYDQKAEELEYLRQKYG